MPEKYEAHTDGDLLNLYDEMVKNNQYLGDIEYELTKRHNDEKSNIKLVSLRDSKTGNIKPTFALTK